VAEVSGYNAFISYSHKHDAVLGTALQHDLEHFAKPWYRMRALRVFRDTTNLSANPALWPSIEAGLESSEWFILLASADAAESEWVEREVRWWLDHRSLDRLLVARASPDLVWDERAQDWAADAPVPQALRGALTGQPRWADLSDIHLDGGKPMIPADRVADLAAPILGKDKDRLVGEHRRQHRRAMRLAGGAITMLAILTALAVTASFIAEGQRDAANGERDAAIQERNAAIRERNQAIANQVDLEVGQLTATDPSLAARLDVVANQFSPTPDSETELLNTTSTLLSRSLTGPTDVVTSVAFSPNGRTLAAGSGDHKVWLWNLTDPAHPGPLGQPLTGPTDYVNSVAFSPDGRTLAAGSDDEKVWLWNLTNPASPARLGAPLTGPTGEVNSVAFSPDGILAAGSDDGEVRLWNLTNPAHPIPLGPPLADLGSASNVISVAFSPDGRTLATGTNEETIQLWSLPSNLLTGPIDGVNSVALSPDGRTLAAGSGAFPAVGTVWLWNLTDPGRPVRLGAPLTGPAWGIYSVAFSRDGILAAGSGDGKVWLWNLTNPAHPVPLGPPLTGPSSVSSVAFSPDGRTLAAGSDDDKVWLWNLTNPAHPVRLLPLSPNDPNNGVSSVAFSRDGILAAGSGDGKVWLWNLTNPVHPVPLGPPLTGPSSVSSVAFSPDGRTLATGSNFDNDVWLWDLTDPASPVPLGQPLTGPTGSVSSVAFSPDGRTLAAGTDDEKAWLWNLTNPAHPVPLGQPLTGPTGSVSSVAFSPDGQTLATGNGDDTVSLLDLDVDYAIQRICASTSNTLTPAQWDQYVSQQLPYAQPCAHPGRYGLLTP